MKEFINISFTDLYNDVIHITCHYSKIHFENDKAYLGNRILNESPKDLINLIEKINSPNNTFDDFHNVGDLNTERIKTYKKFSQDWNVSEGIVRDLFSEAISFTIKNIKK